MTQAKLPTLAAAEAIFLKSGTRLTRLRRQVFVVLLQASGPITAYELLDRLRTERSSSAARVYRSLDFLVAQGLAHRLESRKAFIACAHPDHPHVSQFLICRRCGSTVESRTTKSSLSWASGVSASASRSRRKRSKSLVRARRAAALPRGRGVPC